VRVNLPEIILKLFHRLIAAREYFFNMSNVAEKKFFFKQFQNSSIPVSDVVTCMWNKTANNNYFSALFHV